MSEHVLAASLDRLLQNRRLALAGVTISAFALAACSADIDAPSQTETFTRTVSVPKNTSPETPMPSRSAPSPNKLPNLRDIDCQQIVPGDVLVECTNVPSGHYNLRLKSPSGKSIANYYQQSPGANAELIPEGSYLPLCTKGYVTFFPVPKDGTGKEYVVYSFDVCGAEVV